MLFNPGFLSNEYISGRIQRYIPPFRLYLATSVVFFLLLSFLTSGRSMVVHVQGGAVPDTTLSLGESLQRIAAEDTAGTGAPRKVDIRVRTGWAPVDSVANRRLQELLQLPPQQAVRTVLKEVLQRAPTAVFLALPCFALLLQLLYFRRRRYYVEHFVFALHTHAFLFVLFTILLLGSRVPVLSAPLLLWQLVYCYFALKRYYGQGWFITLVKYGVLGLVYGLVLVVGASFTLVAALVLA